MNFLREAAFGLLDFLYPPYCLHCEFPLQHSYSECLCPSCQELMDLLVPEERCRTCFLPSDDSLCLRCQEMHPAYTGFASVFEHLGPAASLVNAYHSCEALYLAKGIAAYQWAQWGRLSWPVPDYVIPYPEPLDLTIRRGGNPQKELARQWTRYLQIPTLCALIKKCEDEFPYILTKKQVETKKWNAVQVHKGEEIRGKVLLMIMDTLPKESDLTACLGKIRQYDPHEIYVLTFTQQYSAQSY